MNSISLEIEKRLKNGNYEFYENDKSIHISLKIDIIGVNEINLDIPIKENKDISITIKQLYKYIKDTEERIKILEKENEKIKKENQIIKKECEETKEENQQIKNFLRNEINNIVMQPQINIPKNKNKDLYSGQDLLEIEDDINEIEKIRIMNEKIEREEFINTCKFIIIDNIKIKNIGNKTFKHLYFVKDEKESSENIVFMETEKISNNKIHKITFYEEFSPSKETISFFYLRIHYPQINHKYNLIVYIRKEENGPNLSNPLNIVIHVKESDKERIKREEEEERKRQEEERIKKEEERKQIEEEEKKKINELFNKLNQEFDSKLQKEEIVQKIKEFNFDKYKIRKYINNKKSYEIYNIDYQGLNKEEVENLYNELDQEYNLSAIMDKKEVILKIIELRYDRDALNDWIFEQL